MKILHILNSNRFSGAENVVCQIITMFKDDPNIEMIYCSPDGPIREALEERSIPFLALKKLSPSELGKAIKQFQPDFIHAHDFTAGIISAVACRNIPIINHLHNNSPWLKSYGLKSVVYGISCFRFHKILTVSESVMDEYVLGNIWRGKTTVIGNPINIKEVREKSTEKGWDIPYSIAFLGRLSPQKQPELFVDIIHDLSKRIPSITAVMIGEGELKEEVENKIELLNMKDKIIMCGFQKNPYVILNGSKLLCMPSSWEGFGLAAVEGLSLGKPVVAAPVGGLVKIINDSCGMLCAEKEDYVKALYDLLTDEKMYEAKSLGALQRVAEFDNLMDYQKTLFNLYSTML